MPVHAQREAMLQRAREAMVAADHRAAQSLLRYLLRHDPADAEARAMLARLPSRQALSSGALAGQSTEQQPGWMEPEARLGFRSMSMLGAALLLLLLIIALLLPAGAALSEVEAPRLQSAPAHQLRPASDPLASVSAAPHDLLSAMPSSEDARGQVVTPTARAPAEPQMPGQGGTCISGFSIDRYDRPEYHAHEQEKDQPEDDPDVLGRDL